MVDSVEALKNEIANLEIAAMNLSSGLSVFEEKSLEYMTLNKIIEDLWGRITDLRIQYGLLKQKGLT